MSVKHVFKSYLRANYILSILFYEWDRWTSLWWCLNSLKWAHTFGLILTDIDLNKPFIIEVVASNAALGSILSQNGGNRQLATSSFEVREINYKLQDKEHPAIEDSSVCRFVLFLPIFSPLLKLEHVKRIIYD